MNTRTYILLSLTVMLPTLLQAQVAPAYLEIDSTITESKVFVASDYISFKPGFHFKATDNDSLHAYIYQGTQDYALASYQTYIDPTTTPIDKNLPVGSLPGQIDVSSSGAATYQIPIELPFASVDMIPNISLGYNSQAGNGNAGMGWSLQGFSSISKTNKSNYFDGKREQIQFTQDDAVSLDGQRLIYIDGAAHGSTGAIYATEQENYLRVEKTNDGYKATLKNGTTMEYGYTPDARKLKAATDAEEMAWLLNKVSDVHGNYYTIHYIDFGNGEVLPEYVSYSANDAANISAYHQVRFSYMERSDKSERYFKGQKYTNTKLLHSIRVLSEGKTYRKYHLHYFLQQRSKLNTITMEGVNGIRYNPTIIGWENFQHENYYYNNNFGYAFGPQSYADMDGDGMADLSSFPGYIGQKWAIYFNQFHNRYDSLQLPYQSISKSVIGDTLDKYYNRQWNYGTTTTDFNGDKKSDAIGMKELSNYDSTRFNVYNYGTPYEVTHFTDEDTEIMPADYDGNGTSDLLTVTNKELVDAFSGDVTYSVSVELSLFYEDGNTVKRDMLMLSWRENQNIVKVADINGNGLTDILLIFDDYFMIYEWNEEYFRFVLIDTYQLVEGISEDYRLHMGDFNGDGLTDLLTLNIGTPKVTYYADDPNSYRQRHPKAPYYGHTVFLSTGTGLVVDSTMQFDFVLDNDSLYVGSLTFIDLDGDGRTDLFQQRPIVFANVGDSEYDSYWHYNFSTGMDTLHKHWKQPESSEWVATKEYIPYLNLKHDITLTDFDGDSRIDLIFNRNPSVFYFHRETPEEVVTFVRNGLGAQTQVKYLNNSEFSAEVEDYDSEYVPDYFRPNMPVVSELYYPDRHPDPVLSFQYGGALFHPELGLVGSKTLRTTNHLDSTVVDRTFKIAPEQAFFTPLASKTYHYKIEANGNHFLMSEETPTYYPFEALPHGRYRLLLKEQETENFVTKTTGKTTFTYDEHSNLIRQVSELPLKEGGMAYSEQSSTYAPLGNLPFKTVPETTSAKSHVPGADTAHSQQSYFYNGYLLDYTIAQENKSDQTITTQYVYHVGSPKLNYTLTNTTDTQPDGSPYATRQSPASTYDSQKRFVIKQTDVLGNTTQTKWNKAHGLPESVTDVNNLTTYFSYNGFGQLLETTDHRGNKVQQKTAWYQGNAYPEAVYYTETKGKGMPTTKSYVDAWGRAFLTETTTLNGMVVKNRTDVDLQGRTTKSYLPYAGDTPGAAHSFAYDWLGRLETTNFADGISQTISYDYAPQSNRTTTTIDYGGIAVNGGAPLPQTQTAYANNLGQTIKLVNTRDQETEYAYNSFGQATTISNFGNTVSMQYDSLGRQTSLKDPNTDAIMRQYNAFGEIKSQTNADGILNEFYYDAFGRVIHLKVLSNPVQNTYYQYDPENAPGQLASVSDGKGNEFNYHYNNEGQLFRSEQMMEGQVYATQYAYNELGQLDTYTYPSGFSMAYHYDMYGHLIGMTEPVSQTLLWELQEIDAFGNITQYKYGNGVQTNKTYNPFGVLTGIRAPGIMEHGYVFQPQLGNLISRTDIKNNMQESFGYDNMSRLIDVKKGQTSILDVSYDENGNIKTKSDVGTYHYNDNRPHALDNINPVDTSYRGQREQNIHYNTNQDADTIKEWYVTGEAYELSFDFGPTNQRQTATWTLNGEVVKEKKYLDGYELITQNDSATGQPQTKAYHYLSAPSGLLGVWISDADGSNGTLHYVHQDYQGSIMALSDQAGLLEQERSYDAWGRARNPVSHDYENVETPLLDRGYTLHEHLDEFGLIHMNGRLYDPAVGRMLSVDSQVQDPANDQNYNRYSYVLNNPLKYTDPTGERFNINNPMEYVDGFSGAIYADEEAYLTQLNGGIHMTLYRQIYLQRAREMGMIPSETSSTFYFYKDGGQFLGGGNRNTNGDVLLSNGNRVNDGRYYFNTTDKPVGNQDWQFEKNLGYTETNHFGNIGATSVNEYSIAVNRAAGFGGENWNNSSFALDVGGGLYGAMEGITATDNQWLGKNGKYYPNNWNGNQYTGSRSGAYNAGNQYKLAGRGVLIGSVIVGGVQIYSGYQMDGGQFGYNAQVATGSTIGSIAGGIAGAEVGMYVGGAIGALFGGVGAVPGAAIGGFVGGLVGGNIGGEVGQGSVNLYHGR